jgi:hypothetical protein
MKKVVHGEHYTLLRRRLINNKKRILKSRLLGEIMFFSFEANDDSFATDLELFSDFFYFNWS